MKPIFHILNLLESDGTLGLWAVGGAVAAVRYLEPFATRDLDIFAIFPADNVLLDLRPLYARMTELGGQPDGDAVLLHGWPVQILPAFSPLLVEAVQEAVVFDLDGEIVKVFTAEHLGAVMLETGRRKDFARLGDLLESGNLEFDRFMRIVEKFSLLARWQDYQRRFS